MILFLSGEIFGKINQLYNKIKTIESKIQQKCDWLLQTGDFGIFPSNDRATRHIRLNGSSEFESLYAAQKTLPTQTLFIAGKHEDNLWLSQKGYKSEMEILRNLHWLMNGNKTYIGDQNNKISICGLGKVFSPSTYKNIQYTKKSTSHYTEKEVVTACTQGPTDILLTHQTGYGEKIGNFVSNSQGINKICYAIRPKIHIHSGYNISSEYMSKQGIFTISLAHYEIKVLEWNNNQFRTLFSL